MSQVVPNATLKTEATIQLTMEALLALYPGARRTLFQLHHIGGCSSCGFAPSETLEEVCARNGGLQPETVLQEIQAGHEQDEKLLIMPEELHSLLGNPSLKLLDIRTREEFEAVFHFSFQSARQDLADEFIELRAVPPSFHV